MCTVLLTQISIISVKIAAHNSEWLNLQYMKQLLILKRIKVNQQLKNISKSPEK